MVQKMESDPDTLRFGLLRQNCHKGDNIDLKTGAKAPVLQVKAADRFSEDYYLNLRLSCRPPIIRSVCPSVCLSVCLPLSLSLSTNLERVVESVEAKEKEREKGADRGKRKDRVGEVRKGGRGEDRRR